MRSVPLDDPSAFAFVTGLWKGEREPMKQARVLRSTNLRNDGTLDYSDVAELMVEERYFGQRSLTAGDIIIERSGGGPKQPVGRVALFTPPDDQVYFTSNFTTALRVRDHQRFYPEFVALFLHGLYLSGATNALQRATTGIRNLDWQEYLQLRVPEMPNERQQRIVEAIRGVRTARRVEQTLLEVLSDLKRSTMHTLFTRGLRGEAQKESEIGPIPESWSLEPLTAHFNVSSGGTPSRGVPAYWTGGTIPWVKTTEVGYKTITEVGESITQAGLEASAAKMLPVGTLLLAMYGQGVTRGKAAILGIEAACNQACAAIVPANGLMGTRFLYHWLSSRYEAIRQLAHGGQQQNLNLEIVRSLPVVVPPSKEEQTEIVDILDAIDRKIDLHRHKRVVLDELFKSLLHKLMTGEIRVADLDLSALGPGATAAATA